MENICKAHTQTQHSSLCRYHQHHLHKNTTTLQSAADKEEANRSQSSRSTSSSRRRAADVGGPEHDAKGEEHDEDDGGVSAEQREQLKKKKTKKRQGEEDEGRAIELSTIDFRNNNNLSRPSTSDPFLYNHHHCFTLSERRKATRAGVVVGEGSVGREGAA